jgi:hypothetical protein
MVKKFAAFNGTCKFITVFKEAVTGPYAGSMNSAHGLHSKKHSMTCEICGPHKGVAVRFKPSGM